MTPEKKPLSDIVCLLICDACLIGMVLLIALHGVALLTGDARFWL